MAIVFLTGSSDQNDCSLRKDSHGIRVFSCEVTDSKFKSIKANFVLEGEFEQLVAVMQDVPAYKNWQYHMVNPKIVNSNGKDEIIYYSEISAPWPVSNRDVIVSLKFNYDAEKEILEVIALGLPTALPDVEDVIRVPNFNAKWLVRKIKGSSQLAVEYALVIDMGGSIPAWLVNMAQAEGPFETFSKLKERMKLMEYQDKDFSFLRK